MPDAVPQRRKWSLSQHAFDLLLAALGPSPDEAAERYERLRARLIKYFSWERCDIPEDCADEAINRVAKRISEGEQVANPESYCLAAARLVAREASLASQRRTRTVDELARQSHGPGVADESAAGCLETCLGRITADQRTFLLEYYQGEQSTRIRSRRDIAARLGLPLNAVRNRALRLREKLEECMRECLNKEGS